MELISKIAIIWLLIILSAINYPAQSTNAIFSSQVTNTSELKSKLGGSSISVSGASLKNCNEISAFAQYKGSVNMTNLLKYYVYFYPANSPVKPQGIKGKPVFQNGIIPILSPNSPPFRLSYKAEKPGIYQFVVFQPNKSSEKGKSLTIEDIPVTYSEAINVKCPE